MPGSAPEIEHAQGPVASRADRAKPAPLVSVGMPVYNSARWIRATLESILSQTCQDLELIISDNASTDETLSICEEYARRDARIRVIRHARNRGANENYMAVLREARGTYFKWASSSDLCAPTFLEQCVRALEAEPAAVLACPRSVLFDAEPAAGTRYGHDIELLSEHASDRFIDLQNRLRLNNAMNGVFRREAFARVSRLGNYLRADLILMAELALTGKFLLVEDFLFFRRMSPESATALRSTREFELHHVPTAKARLKWQVWRYWFALIGTVRLVRFASRDWFRVAGYSLRAMVWLREDLLKDFLLSIRNAGEA